MKKLLLTFALASAVVVVNAQDMTSKRGVPILPEAGEWALGIDATPLFEYFGNLFTESQNDAPSFDFSRQNTLWFKYVRDEGFHYRGMLRLGFGGETSTLQSDSDLNTTTAQVFVDDECKSSNMNIAIGAGFEKRRGKGRLQGYYGPELIVNFGSSSREYTYGNAITADNTAPTFNVFTENQNFDDPDFGIRTTKVDDGSTFGLTLRGFVGLEYFFAPKLAIGGEFGWGLGFQSRGDAERSFELFDGTSVVSLRAPAGSSSSFGIDTDNVGGAIRLIGYF